MTQDLGQMCYGWSMSMYMYINQAISSYDEAVIFRDIIALSRKGMPPIKETVKPPFNLPGLPRPVNIHLVVRLTVKRHR